MSPADQFHVLDEVQAFGVTAHGLVRYDPSSGNRRFVDGVPWPTDGGPYQVNSTRVLQLVRKPGIGPVPLTDEQLTAERSVGRVWQNYALLLVHGSDRTTLFGRDNVGWIYWASDGQPWSISPPSYGLNNATVGAPYALTFECRPFGRFGSPPAVTQTLTVTVDDVGQFSSPSLSRRVAFETINSTGSHVILALMSPTGELPLGFLQITVTDSDGVIDAAMSVHLTEQNVRGEWESNVPASVPSLFDSKNYKIAGELTPEFDAMQFPEGGGAFSFAVTGLVEAAGITGGAMFGEARLLSRRTGRVLRITFDDADELVTHTCSVSYTLEMNYPDFTGKVNGEGAASASWDARFEQVDWGLAVSLDLTRDVQEVITAEVSLYANGELVASADASQRQQSTQRRTLEFSNSIPVLSAGDWCVGYYDWGYLVSYIQAGFASGRVVSTVSATPFDYTASRETSADWPANGFLGLYSAMVSRPEIVDVSASLTGVEGSVVISAYRGKAGVSLQRTQPPPGGGPVRPQYGLALVYPHAAAYELGAALDYQHAYHPATHELVTDATGGQPVSFT
ncbi:hypothetical protein [Ectopseudomonas mendocina]|uniref:hypothetical protein n=1 Tax=Ectopseudomonas mendocina TaxID=300 RepID=UPI003F05D6C7